MVTKSLKTAGRYVVRRMVSDMQGVMVSGEVGIVVTAAEPERPAPPRETEAKRIVEV